jgi:cation transporter-like permease
MKNRKHTITKQVIRLLSGMKKHKHDHRVHAIHAKHKISYKTLFYMKEYGPRSHISTVIFRESIKILILTSVISSLGGIHLKSIESSFLAYLPLIIILPALSDMIGDFGTIASSKFTTMLFLGKIGKRWWESEEVRKLASTLMAVALISSVYISVLSFGVAHFLGFGFSWVLFQKIFMICVAAVVSLVSIILILSIVGGLWIFHRKEDPNNFLIPVTTSIADFGSMFILSLLVTLIL